MSDTAYNVYQHYGTAAARASFTPAPPSSGTPNPIYIWYETDTDNHYIYTTAWKGPFSISSGGNVCGRLTTESGVPVSTSDRTAQGTIYWTPYNGDTVPLYTGSAWTRLAFSEISLALSGLTSGKNYDVFLYNNSGTLALELSAAWTTDTARADALALQNGLYVKSGTTTRLWVGTIRTTGTTTTADSGGITGTSQTGGQRFVWNAYNQVPRVNKVIDTTDGWNYATHTIRQADNAAGNKVEWVTGDGTSQVNVRVIGTVALTGNTVNPAKVGVGIDSVTVFSGMVQAAYFDGVNFTYHALLGEYIGTPGLGYHYAAWLEKGATAGTCTFKGDNGGDGQQAGLNAVMLG